MKTRLLMLLLLLTYTSAAQAGFIRLIAFKLKPACTIANFMVINKDMNQFSNEHGVSAEVMLPVFTDTPDVYIWKLRYKNAKAWGGGNDAFWLGVYAEDPIQTKVYTRLLECTEIIYSHGYRTMAK